MQLEPQLESQFSIYSSVTQTNFQPVVMYNQDTQVLYQWETELDYSPNNGAWRAAVLLLIASPLRYTINIFRLLPSLFVTFTSATTQPGCSQRSINMVQRLEELIYIDIVEVTPISHVRDFLVILKHSLQGPLQMAPSAQGQPKLL